MRFDLKNIAYCTNRNCARRRNIDVGRLLREALRGLGREGSLRLIETDCLGFCEAGPLIMFLPPGTSRPVLDENTFAEQLDTWLRELQGSLFPLSPVLPDAVEEGIPTTGEVDFFGRQMLLALRNRGHIDPDSIEEYIAHDGYLALHKVLTAMTPEEVVDEVKKSNIRGRGGAGFPTGRKWEEGQRYKVFPKYVICNGDEGDPGAFMDRTIMESDPHAVIEGMAICGYAVCAAQGYIYVRAEYPLAIQSLQNAIDRARDRGLLGRDLMGSDFSFDIEIYPGAGAFVCGESTALMYSLEGKRGMPRTKPPRSTESGLWGKPTVLNNVETFANIPQILLRGGDWFRSIGTEDSTGTKVFSLTGAVKNSGIIEVPMGTILRSLIFDIGGGMKVKAAFKAVQLGGPSGGCLAEEHLGVPVTFDSLEKAGAMMGSGGVVVMDDSSCMVDVARFFTQFSVDESCGKCVPCRVGLKVMLNMLDAITAGKGEEGDIERLQALGEHIRDTSHCGLGQAAANPALSTLRYFRHEYEAHIGEKHCTAGVCTALFASPCQNACPVGMDVPSYLALVRAGRIDDAYRVLVKTNPFPAICGRVCDHHCQSRCRRAQVDEAIAIKHVKRFITDNGRKPPVQAVPVTRNEKIAVLGAGPAGLTAARDLALRGYKVTVYDALPEPGGMMRSVIPTYRLPRDVVRAEIDDIAALGVEIICNTRVGRDISFEGLMDAYDYLYVATGAHRSQSLGLPGEDSKGFFGGVDYLTDFNLNEKDWTSGKKSLGRRVAVIGGGNSAIDAARVAVRLGATVTILYRRSREDMPASEDEIRAAEDEGVRIMYFVAPRSIIAVRGIVIGLTCQRMVLGDSDRTGRRRPIPAEGSDFSLVVDSIICAIGQSPDPSFVPEDMGISVNRWACFDLAEGRKSQTTHPRVFAGGDAVTGALTVIKAIQAGRAAAVEIDEAIRASKGEPPWEAPEEELISVPLEIDETTEERPRILMPELEAAWRIAGFVEVDLGYSLDSAMAEASRCLRCDAGRNTTGEGTNEN